MDGISVQEAANRLGVSERTIRRRIKAGKLVATQIPTSQGYEWSIHLDNAVQVDRGAVHLDNTAVQPTEDAHPTRADEHALLRTLELVEKLQRENLDLAGRVGFYQAKLQDAEEQIRLLSAPKEPEKPKAPWWRKLLRNT